MEDRIKLLVSLLFVMMLVGEGLATTTLKDLPYYAEDAPVSGNLAYREERCKLDLVYPEEMKGFTTVVYFHGGGLTGGSKDLPQILVDHNIAVATANYRLSGQHGTKAPDYIVDAAAAVAWVLKHIREYGGDEQKVYVSGHSAGGYLAAMVGLDASYLTKFGAAPTQLAGILPLSAQMTTHFQILQEYRDADPHFKASVLIDKYAPVFHERKDAPRLVLFVGDGTIEFPARVEENLWMVSRMRRMAAHPHTTIHQFTGCDHNSMREPALRQMIKEIIR